MSEERLERLAAHLKKSPDMYERILKAAKAGRLPPAIAGSISLAGMNSFSSGSVKLESVMGAAALEAIVKRFGRPPLIVSDDQVELEPLGDDMPTGTDILIKKAEAMVRSVGRVEFVNFRMGWGGTGWVIDSKGRDRIIATNRHVAALVAKRTAEGKGVFLRAPFSGAKYGAAIDFKEEVGSVAGEARPVNVVEIIYLADAAAPDAALLRISGENLPDPLPLAQTPAKLNEPVALIGYPAYDPRNDATDQARYFRDLYEVKRFAPGLVTQAPNGAALLSHDCTSLGGNSGSPLLSLERGEVVGLHFAGEYGVNNSAVGVETLRNLIAGRPAAQLQAFVSASEAGSTEGRKDGTHQAAYFKGRKGYNPNFLDNGVAAPWPGITEALQSDLAKPSDEDPEQPFELRYTHFGVRFSRKLRLPLMTAVNLDGEHSVRIKRGNDQWFADARIPLDDQLQQRDYADLDIDRGHMVRREDPNWGSDEVARLADGDTFHYTNAAPQHSTLNQGKQLWQGLENYILNSARTHGFKACVFTGPVIGKDDPEIEDGVLAPREFWKLIAMVDKERETLHATAYLLSQGDLIRDLLEKRNRTEAVEGFVLGPYRTFQITVKDLAEATGYNFSAYAAADPLARSKPGLEAVETGEPVYVPLETLDYVIS